MARIDRRLLVALAALALLLPGLGGIGLWAPDEPRAAAVAREMFRMKQGPEGLVLLHLNAEPYTQKPPLYYWLVGLFSIPGGQVSEWSARIPSALAGLATLALTWALGRRLLGARSALLGVALLLTTYKFAYLSRRVQFDVVLALFELGALLAFVRLDRGVGAASRNRLWIHACMGLAMLTKGPVGLLVPVLVMAGYLGLEGRLRELRRVFSAGGLVLSLGPVLAWLAAAVVLAPPGFFGEAVGGGLVSRFFEGTSHARPFYYYLYQFPIEFLPWTLLWPVVWVAARRRILVDGADPDRRRAWRFLGAWVGVTVLFFSVSAGKRGLYLLPCFPALALLCADALRAVLAERTRPPRVLTACVATGALALVGLGLFFGVRHEIAGAPVPDTFAALVLGAPLAAAWAWRASVRAGRLERLPAVAVGCAWVVLAALFQVGFPALDEERSMKPVAEAALRWLPPGAPVALLGSETMVGGLAYYAERPVTFLDEADEVPGYFAGGGAAVIMKERKLERVRQHAPVVVRERLREGDRSLVVVQPVDAERAVSPGPAEAGSPPDP